MVGRGGVTIGKAHAMHNIAGLKQGRRLEGWRAVGSGGGGVGDRYRTVPVPCRAGLSQAVQVLGQATKRRSHGKTTRVWR